MACPFRKFSKMSEAKCLHRTYWMCLRLQQSRMAWPPLSGCSRCSQATQQARQYTFDHVGQLCMSCQPLSAGTKLEMMLENVVWEYFVQVPAVHAFSGSTLIPATLFTARSMVSVTCIIVFILQPRGLQFSMGRCMLQSHFFWTCEREKTE